jgi:hypothetical protein
LTVITADYLQKLTQKRIFADIDVLVILLAIKGLMMYQNIPLTERLELYSSSVNGQKMLSFST